MPSERTSVASDYRGNQPKSTQQLSEWHERSEPAEVIAADLPIVDPHHHVFGSASDRQYYRLEDLQRDLDSGHRVIGTVYVEAYNSGWRKTGPEALRPVGEVEMITALTKVPIATASGDCQVAAGIVCHADLTLGDGVDDVLRQQMEAAQGRLRGVRHRAAAVDGTIGRYSDGRKPHLLIDPKFRRGFAQIEGFGLSFDAWIYHTQLDELIDLVDQFPNTTIVVNHLAAPLGVGEFRSQQAQVHRAWESGMRDLASRPNAYMKLGGLGMPLFGFGFEHGDRPAKSDVLARAWKPYIEVCVDAFGTNRCMFESNFPVDKQSCSYGDLWNAFKFVTQGWSRQECRDLFYRTACRTYRLPVLEVLGDELHTRTAG